MDYNAPASEVIEQWQEKSEKMILEQEYKQILLARPYSMHPDDWYLSIVMAALPHNNLHPYVTWKHNSTGKTADYFCEGHYFTDKREAFEDWKTR
jgi:hypothetical protein